MTIDTASYHPRIREYLQHRGIEITRTDADRIRCLNHTDEHASMIIYEKAAGGKMDGLYCPVCDAKMDIFEAARIIAGIPSGDDNFPAVVDEVLSTLGESNQNTPVQTRNVTVKPPVETPVKPEPVKKPIEKNNDFVSLDAVKMKDVYKRGDVLRMGTFGLRGRGKSEDIFTNGQGVTEIEGVWKNLNPDGTLAFIEVRFPAKDFKDGKKKYLTIWYDGEKLRSSNPPIMLYNRDKLAANPSAPFCWHEGPKSIFGMGDIVGGESVPGFIHTGWNSGGKKIGLCDFEELRGRTGYLYPDDDMPDKHHSLGTGIETALELKRILEGEYGCTIKVCKPLEEAKPLKPTGGADIVEALQVRTPEEMATYLRDGPELREDKAPGEIGGKPQNSGVPSRNAVANIPGLTPLDGHDNSGGIRGPENNTPPITPPRGDLPFKILGIADDKNAYFLSEQGRLYHWKPETINKDRLNTLAGLAFWSTYYPMRRGIDWETAIDDIRREIDLKDFAVESMRGRGAWRNDTESGPLYLYWDGGQLFGGEDSGHTYIKSRRRKIDFSLPHPPIETRQAMMHAAGLLSFETQADAVKLMGWCLLAPFGGALPWRPAGFLSGDSGSGKSTVFKYIVRPLSGLTSDDVCTGSESSGAGVRQHNPFDSVAIGIEESDSDDDDKKRNVKSIISIMRVSTSDETPDAWKGTQDQNGTKFGLRKMFLFIAIDNTIGEAADVKRFFYVNVARPHDTPAEWKVKKDAILRAFTDENCEAVRALTWAALPEIVEYSEKLAEQISTIVNISTRYALGEALLFSAWWRIFKDRFPTHDEAEAWLKLMYSQKSPEVVEDEPEQMLDRLLGEVVKLDGDFKKQESVGRICSILSERKINHESKEYAADGDLLPYRRTAYFCGIYVNTGGELCVLSKSPYLEKLFANKNYAKKIARHPMVREKSKLVRPGLGYKPQLAVVFDPSVLATDEVPF